MVAAGVYLVARFYPVFTPEVLLVIAVVGCLTLFMAATIAITATDIKRVLAYSTVSQLGYMMMALGVGGWLAGILHLFTHAFFKGLLFMCSGSVIHAVHTNEMPLMGGLRKKMPWTAYTMLAGCLAIAGAGIPFVIGLSGYYSKDAILEQALSFMGANPTWGRFFFFAAAGGAAITAFYMFRLWYMTFCGPPRDEARYRHAHESPPVMYVPLVILSVFAIAVAWKPIDLNLVSLLEQARPAGTAATVQGALVKLVWPNELDLHAPANHGLVVKATLIAFGTALSGFLLATIIYAWRLLSPDEIASQFRPVYRFLLNKWWFDELYDLVFVRPVLAISYAAAYFDRRWIDGFIDGLARAVRSFSALWDRVADQQIVDGCVNSFARWTYSLGCSLREVQTGRLRQYVMFIVVGTVAVFILISFFWSFTLAR
jgi:NADH-quinone oxidoreductase subunit L